MGDGQLSIINEGIHDSCTGQNPLMCMSWRGKTCWIDIAHYLPNHLTIAISLTHLSLIHYLDALLLPMMLNSIPPMINWPVDSMVEVKF